MHFSRGSFLIPLTQPLFNTSPKRLFMDNNSSTKKIIIIAVVVLVIAGIGIFGWMVYAGKAGVVGEKIRTFLPFGSGGEDRPAVIPTTNPETNGGMIVGEDGRLVSLLRKLHNSPVAGVYAFTKKIAGTTTQDVVVRYIERGLGHVYETNMSNLKEERISNETRLKIYEALWGNAGNGVVIRYLNGDKNDTIQTYSMVLRDIKNATTTEEGRRIETDGVFLPENISEVAISQEKGDRMFYVLPTGDSSVGITAGFDGKKQVQVFDSPLKEWLSFWPNDKLITLTTKPSQNVPGFMYFLDAQTGKTTKILGRINGLTALTSSGGKNKCGFIMRVSVRCVDVNVGMRQQRVHDGNMSTVSSNHQRRHTISTCCVDVNVWKRQ